MKVDAMVLAGAPNTGKLQEVSPEEYEATIPVGGKPLISYVVDAIKSTPRIREIVVVGPKVLAELLPAGVRLVESGSSLTDNILRGTAALRNSPKILVVTSDIPFIHRDAIEDFLDRCAELQADLYYPIVSKEANEQVYPDCVRTYVTLKEGTFTGGNMVLATPAVLSNSKQLMAKVVTFRKKPWKLAKILGLSFVVKLFLKQLSLAELEKRASQLLGVRGVAIISPYPEIGTDVDKPSDLELAERIMGAVSGSREA
ncbi:MAG: NTP transferase domain-containing protein [Firmicutes bacterium]|jgi:GTP:adenosylcobinamide-phosphate guanylyltransferase|nr:NTP transferase domain-containing protein [Bacillota bacterium]